MRIPEMSENALVTLNERYFWKDENGNPTEDAVGLFHRVADFLFPEDDEKRNEAFRVMRDRIFLPNTPTLVNAGRENAQLSACFVLPIEDSMHGIFTTVHDTAIIQKTGGGTGFSFSHLRAKGSRVNSTGGQASGVISFLNVFNAATESVKQGGVRRGANMGILRVDHPEIMDFIRCKDDPNKINNFNLSVGVTDDFMRAVENGGAFDLIDPHTKHVVDTVPARDIWDAIVHQAWKNGEPGIIFLDEMNRHNPTPEYGEIESTNPCVTGDTLVLTDRGYYPIQELVGAEVTIWNGFEWSSVKPEVTGHRCRILHIQFNNGNDIECTRYHKFVLEDGRRIEAQDLKVGDVLAEYSTKEPGDKQEVWNCDVTVTSIEDAGIADTVYCFTEPINHTGIFNGIMTGQCGEQPLLPYESCNLGSIDLSKLVRKLPSIAGDGEFYILDKVALAATVKTAVDILNAVLDHNTFPLPQIKENTLRTRKIGLGIMGWADLLLLLDIPYDSDRAINFARDIMQSITETARRYSDEKGYNNATVTTIAPTGTLSMIADCSGGIEPNFSWVYTRKSMDKELKYINPIVAKTLKEIGLYSDYILEQLERGVPMKDIPELTHLGNVYKTSQEIEPYWHVKMQAAFQEFTDNAVSKTINLPPECDEATISRIFMDAWSMKCKGITVYRDGSRDNQVLNHKTDEPKEDLTNYVSDWKEKKPRPYKLFGSTSKWNIGCGKLYITANHDTDGFLEEVFTTTGKYGGCPSQSEATSRIISLALRYGVPADDIIRQLKGIRCKNCVHKNDLDAMSCPDAIAKAMEEALDDIWCEDVRPESNATKNLTYEEKDGGVSICVRPVCPECGAPLIHAEGCVRCSQCTYSKCNG